MNVKKDVNDDMSAILEHDNNTKVKFFKGDRCNFKITYDLAKNNKVIFNAPFTRFYYKISDNSKTS